MKIQAFQTGRTYAREGQRIAYAETTRDADEFLQLATVVFYDVDRGIDGQLTIAVAAGDPVTDRDVLNAYDRGGYSYSADRALVQDLKTAARAVAPLGKI